MIELAVSAAAQHDQDRDQAAAASHIGQFLEDDALGCWMRCASALAEDAASTAALADRIVTA